MTNVGEATGLPGMDQKPTCLNMLRAQHSACKQDMGTDDTRALSPRHSKGPRGALSGGSFPPAEVPESRGLT